MAKLLRLTFIFLNLVKSVKNRRCASSMFVQSLCEVWITLNENWCRYRVHQLGTLYGMQWQNDRVRNIEVYLMVKSILNRRWIFSSMFVQLLCKFWIMLNEIYCSYRLHKESNTKIFACCWWCRILIFFSYFSQLEWLCPTVTMLETNVVSYRLFYISVYRKLLHNIAMILDFSLE